MTLVENLIKENIGPKYADLAKRVWTLLYLKPQQYPFFWYWVEVEAFARPFINYIQRFCQYFIGDNIQQITDEEIGKYLPFIMGDDVTSIVLEDMASMNDLIKAHGKALPKFKRTFYELKHSVIRCPYWRTQCIRDIWQEWNDKQMLSSMSLGLNVTGNNMFSINQRGIFTRNVYASTVVFAGLYISHSI